MFIKTMLARLWSAITVFLKLRPSPGIIITISIIAIPSFAWAIGYDFSGMSNLEVTGTVLKKIAGFGGMAMFAWTLILAGRYKFLDSWFRGLDQMYLAHRFFGTLVMGLLILHPLGYTLLHIAEQGTGDLVHHFLGWASWPVTLGRISLYGLLLIGAWSILVRVKHETFISIHRWLGAMFIVGTVHAFLSGPESVLATNQFMWWYMLILSSAAILTFLHYSVLGDVFHAPYRYKVESVKVLAGNVVDIVLKPKYRAPNFRPGQFFYVAFDSLGSEDYHPYSVASGKNSLKMRFLVKELGDYTNELVKLKPGTAARLKGPYGGFTFDDKKHEKQLWIAGGIGITPFLSKAYSLNSGKLTPEIKMIHFARTKQEAIDRKILDIIEERHRAFDYTYLPQNKFGIVSLKDISEQMGSLKDYVIYMCGPPGMMTAYDKQAKELGLDNQLFYEEFSY